MTTQWHTLNLDGYPNYIFGIISRHFGIMIAKHGLIIQHYSVLVSDTPHQEVIRVYTFNSAEQALIKVHELMGYL
jgi:hypothetical protein